jgi:Domain of unknown function (DUF5667)
MSALSVSLSPAERRRAREFAGLLEGSHAAAGHELESLAALASSLRPADIVPRGDFRAALRESLVAEAAARRLAPSVATSPAPPERRHRVRTVVATGVLVSLVGGVGAAAASTHALPGDSLYGLKRGLESAQLRFAHSDLSRGRELLDQADNRLSEAEALAASEDARSPETTARIAGAITDLDTSTRAGAAAMEASYADTGDIEPLLELDRFVVDQRTRLAELSALLSPGLRALLSPLSELLLTLQPHLESLVAASSTTPGAAAGSAGAQPGGGSVAAKPPLTGNGVDVTDAINGLTRGASSTAGSGAAVTSPGGLGTGAAASALPSPVPHISLPHTAVPRVSTPSVPLPSVSVPGVPAPSVPAPSVPAPSLPSVPAPSLPSVPLPTPTTIPTLPPVTVDPPLCVPIPPLTTC